MDDKDGRQRWTTKMDDKDGRQRWTTKVDDKGFKNRGGAASSTNRTILKEARRPQSVGMQFVHAAIPSNAGGQRLDFGQGFQGFAQSQPKLGALNPHRFLQRDRLGNVSGRAPL
jgi:hypothetical protein